LHHDVAVRLLDGVGQRLGDRRLVVGLPVQHRQPDRIGDRRRHRLDGQRRGLLAIVMPAHAIGHHEQPEVGAFVGAAAADEIAQYGILIVVSDHADIAQLPEHQVIVAEIAQQRFL